MKISISQNNIRKINIDNFNINLTMTEFGGVPEIARIALVAGIVRQAGSEYELIMNCL